MYNTSSVLLKEAVQNVGIDVDPQKVLTNFELALQQSVAICFPQAERKRLVCATLPPWTNNNAEGWHSKVRKLAAKVHPNIYKAVTLFKAEEAATEVSFIQLEAGGLLNRRRKHRKQEKGLIMIKVKYEAGDYTLSQTT